jgi:hypothetical protein
MDNFDDILGELNETAGRDIGEVTANTDGDEILFRFKKDLVLDMWCIYGEDGLCMIGEAIADMVATNVVKVVEENAESLEERKQKLLEVIKNAR